MIPLRVGIAGYGVVGKRRRQVIDQRPGLKTIAVCDRVFPHEGTFEDGVRYYRNYRQLLDEDLDILFVCMTNDMAPEVMIAAQEKGLHVFCESPPPRDLDDGLRVTENERKHAKQQLKHTFDPRYRHAV